MRHACEITSELQPSCGASAVGLQPQERHKNDASFLDHTDRVDRATGSRQAAIVLAPRLFFTRQTGQDLT